MDSHKGKIILNKGKFELIEILDNIRVQFFFVALNARKKGRIKETENLTIYF